MTWDPTSNEWHDLKKRYAGVIRTMRNYKRTRDAAAAQLNASIYTLEESLRLANFETGASVPFGDGRCYWALCADRRGNTSWRILCTHPDSDAPRPLTDAPLAIRVNASNALDALLTTILEAEENRDVR